MKEILLFRHQSWIEAPHLTNLLTELDIPYRVIKIDEGDRVPKDIEENTGALVFWGGTMSVNDPLPWIDEELALIQKAHQKNIPMLGHCLGSQLISKALGGQVTPMKQKEIGWHPISFHDNKEVANWQGGLANELKVLLWHHDEFSLPEGATSLYQSPFCKNQAFVKGNILATVAHIEASVDMLEHWLDVYGDDISPNNGSMQSVDEIRQDIEQKTQEMHSLTNSFYRKWLHLVYDETTESHLYQKIITHTQ